VHGPNANVFFALSDGRAACIPVDDVEGAKRWRAEAKVATAAATLNSFLRHLAAT
jgi:hypothetical protein